MPCKNEIDKCPVTQTNDLYLPTPILASVKYNKLFRYCNKNNATWQGKQYAHVKQVGTSETATHVGNKTFLKEIDAIHFM